METTLNDLFNQDQPFILDDDPAFCDRQVIKVAGRVGFEADPQEAVITQTVRAINYLNNWLPDGQWVKKKADGYWIILSQEQPFTPAEQRMLETPEMSLTRQQAIEVPYIYDFKYNSNTMQQNTKRDFGPLIGLLIMTGGSVAVWTVLTLLFL